MGVSPVGSISIPRDKDDKRTIVLLLSYRIIFNMSSRFHFMGNVGAATLTGHSNLMVSINSDVIFEWFFDNMVGQQVLFIEFGVIDSSTRVKFFDIRPVGLGSAIVYPIVSWPSTFAWYQNRTSWAGDLVSKRITFKITNSTLKDSNKFYCRVVWKNPADIKTSIINLLIVGKVLIFKYFNR